MTSPPLVSVIVPNPSNPDTIYFHGIRGLKNTTPADPVSSRRSTVIG